MASSDLYDRDFFCWTVENAALLRARRFDQIDLQHLADEIEDMGKRDRHEVQSKLLVLIAHLLKWQFQPSLRSASWKTTIVGERVELPLIFKQSPSLLRYAAEDLPDVYRGSVKLAKETVLPKTSFPADCPFTLDQILDDEFLPDSK